MSYINPYYYKYLNLKKENNIKDINEKKGNIININDILNDSTKSVSIQYFKFPTNSIITGVPRIINLSTNELGNVVIKYESNDFMSKTI